ncbi:MAG: HEPN domain-containing protein [Candidatus Bathyarchaeia archaeon]
MEVLRRRSEGFLRDAEVDYCRGDYDLVLFHVEQSLQLYLKYLIYLKIGDHPKTHSLTRLVKDAAELYEDDALEAFYNDNIELLYLLEEAYITSRYLPRTYEEEIAKRILQFSKAAKEVFQCLETV